MNIIDVGCVNIWIDDIVPCLRENESGELKGTFVFRVESRAFLKNFKAKDGWGIDWKELPQNLEIFALALEENNEIQGLIALKNDVEARAAYIHWVCTAPQNNKHRFGSQKYSGVGGHLFAIAADKSEQWGYEGFVYGFALNKVLLNHYIDVMGATYLGIQHSFHFMLDGVNAKKLLEVYTYEWN